jgi:hypothetical protein
LVCNCGHPTALIIWLRKVDCAASQTQREALLATIPLLCVTCRANATSFHGGHGRWTS